MTKEGSRLRWQCRRGMLELDVILQSFFDQTWASLSIEDQQNFEQLLTYPDPVLYGWLIGFEKVEDPKLLSLIDLIRKVTINPTDRIS